MSSHDSPRMIPHEFFEGSHVSADEEHTIANAFFYLYSYALIVTPTLPRAYSLHNR